MTETANTTEYTIDATGKRLGNIATEAATILMGKKSPNFAKNAVAPTTVHILNVSKLDIPDKKKNEIYQTYSGHPSGRKVETLDHLANRRGYSEVVRRTIKGMLPQNRLKDALMKNLIVSE